MKRQVFVKVSPAGMRVSSGMVTSSSSTAWILQSTGAVAARVAVVVPVPVTGVNGVLVGGRARAFVGGRVAVTN